MSGGLFGGFGTITKVPFDITNMEPIKGVVGGAKIDGSTHIFSTLRVIDGRGRGLSLYNYKIKIYICLSK